MPLRTHCTARISINTLFAEQGVRLSVLCCLFHAAQEDGLLFHARELFDVTFANTARYNQLLLKLFSLNEMVNNIYEADPNTR